MQLEDSVREIKGVGEKAQSLYKKLHIETVGDLLEHYPREYDSYEDIVPIHDLVPGKVAAVCGTIAAKPRLYQSGGRKVVQMTLRDGSGELTLTWFNMPFVIKQFHQGTRYILRGKVERRGVGLVMAHPQVLTEQEFYRRLHMMQPIYALTAGLTNAAVTKAVRAAFENVSPQEEYLPAEIRKRYDLILYKNAIRAIHFPKGKKDMEEARKRLVFDEFFIFMLAMKQLTKQREKECAVFAIQDRQELEELEESLGYSLTVAQRRCLDELKKDLTSGRVMNRLVQGDVGSGKTIVAMMALLLVAKNGCQGAMMAPTEVLAKQHYESFCKLLAPFGVKTVLLTGSMKQSEKKEVYQEIASGEASIIIGTHALIQEKVAYHKLALVVTDEQHRFGVRQRELLSEKGEKPHMLVMSATPIPRTLAIILYGDLDISLIDELPAKRLPIKNCVVGEAYRPTAYHFMEQQVAEGRQVYVICPMVEESEGIEAENVLDYTDRLRSVMPPSVRIEYLHGRLKAEQKNEIMERFKRGEIDILVSTTVIEVGINVPNATVMMVENAERFGLAQLHQLRGRVGRGEYQSYCIFMSSNEGKQCMERLELLVQSNDGFFIANEDLKLRGPGDMFGVRQSGELYFKLADIYEDAGILYQANEAAATLTSDEVNLLCKKYEPLRKRLRAYGEEVAL